MHQTSEITAGWFQKSCPPSKEQLLELKEVTDVKGIPPAVLEGIHEKKQPHPHTFPPTIEGQCSPQTQQSR